MWSNWKAQQAYRRRRHRKKSDMNETKVENMKLLGSQHDG